MFHKEGCQRRSSSSLKNSEGWKDSGMAPESVQNWFGTFAKGKPCASERTCASGKESMPSLWRGRKASGFGRKKKKTSNGAKVREVRDSYSIERHKLRGERNWLFLPKISNRD